jgi:hypothetical protein
MTTTPNLEGSPWRVTSSDALAAFSVVRAVGSNAGGQITVEGALADSVEHTAPILGVTQTALDGSGTDRAHWMSSGPMLLRCEAGLTLAHSSEQLYLSETDAGAVTNVAPTIAVPVGCSLDTDAYDGSGQLVITAAFSAGVAPSAAASTPKITVQHSDSGTLPAYSIVTHPGGSGFDPLPVSGATNQGHDGQSYASGILDGDVDDSGTTTLTPLVPGTTVRVLFNTGIGGDIDNGKIAFLSSTPGELAVDPGAGPYIVPVGYIVSTAGYGGDRTCTVYLIPLIAYPVPA